MSDMLSIGVSGLRAYQSALGTVSENISNAATDGYSRRSVALREVSSVSGSITQSGVVPGNGVVANAIVRAADDLRAAAVRTAGTDLARTESGIGWLEGVETALTGNRLSDRLTSFFSAAQTLSADPSSIAARTTMLEAAGAAASAFRGTGAALDTVAAAIDAGGAAAAATLSDLAANLSQINTGIGRAAPGSSAAAQLADQRDRLLDQMSAVTGVSVSLDAAGRASVRIGDGAGPVLVAPDGLAAGQVTYARGEDGAVAFQLHRAGEAVAIEPSGGALAGIVDGAERVAAAAEQLDAIAAGFVAGVNGVQAGGRDLDGNAGAPLFAVGATPTDISVTLTNPRGLAAAAVGGGTRDNGNLIALQALRSSGGYEAGVTGLVAGNAAALSSRKSVADAQQVIRDGAVAARDSVSGVNLDDEAVDLLRFQQAYQASARVIQVARETLQSILEIR